MHDFRADGIASGQTKVAFSSNLTFCVNDAGQRRESVFVESADNGAEELYNRKQVAGA